MKRVDLERRTLALAVGVVRMVAGLKAGAEREVVANQILRSATSVGANYREANRAESMRDFAHKIAVTEKEAAETHYWLEVMRDAGLADRERIKPLLDECIQIVRILNAARRTLRNKQRSNATVSKSSNR